MGGSRETPHPPSLPPARQNQTQASMPNGKTLKTMLCEDIILSPQTTNRNPLPRCPATVHSLVPRSEKYSTWTGRQPLRKRPQSHLKRMIPPRPHPVHQPRCEKTTIITPLHCPEVQRNCPQKDPPMKRIHPQPTSQTQSKRSKLLRLVNPKTRRDLQSVLQERHRRQLLCVRQRRRCTRTLEHKKTARKHRKSLVTRLQPRRPPSALHRATTKTFLQAAQALRSARRALMQRWKTPRRSEQKLRTHFHGVQPTPSLTGHAAVELQ